MSNAAFILIHGAWHGASTWERVAPLLLERDFAVEYFDLPGAGQNAEHPRSYGTAFIDEAAFATEISPNAHVGQSERTAAVVDRIDRLKAAGYDSVVLVGHSLGGATVTAVAEARPDDLLAVVYVCAYMVPPKLTVSDVRQWDVMQGSLVGKLQVADPRLVGALRINPRSSNLVYRSLMKTAFAADLSDADFAEMAIHLHPDEPLGPVRTPSPMTRQRFGRVPRFFLKTHDDRAIPPVAQDRLIFEVDGAVGSLTVVESLTASHSPQASQPDEVAAFLAAVASHR